MKNWGDTYNWLDYIADFEDTLEASKKDILENAYPEDRINEEVDSHIPIYNRDRAMLLANNLDLGFPQDPAAFEGENIFDVIAWAIHEELLGVARAKLEEWQNEEEDAEE